VDKEERKILVVGAGVMGHGIAQTFAQGGFSVTMVDINQQALDKGLTLMTSSLETMKQEGFLDQSMEDVIKRVKVTTSLADGAQDADFAIEVIQETVEAKRKILTELDKVCPPKTLLASNTSYINIFDFTEISRQDKMLITHWYAPPQLIPLVDVVGGPHTEAGNLDVMAAVLKKLGKKPMVLKKYISGYAINRIQHALNREIMYLIDNDYVTPEQIDEGAIAGLALRMMVVGVIARYDFGGISDKTLKPHGFEEIPQDYQPKKLRQLIEKGYLGAKTGRGFFDYTGRTESDLYRERDVRLMEMLRTLKKLDARGPLGMPCELRD
jgi:3-hydroxybutyryl-CoA dehydrogenase